VVQLIRLQEWRERKALTQQELAWRAGVGEPLIALLEQGADQRYPSITHKLAQALEVEPAELMGTFSGAFS
jgi:transcriptional regulator with XRE-family HTH domain